MRQFVAAMKAKGHVAKDVRGPGARGGGKAYYDIAYN